MGSEGAGATRSGDAFHNEDAFLVSDELGLYVVCDGASAEPAGETAASLAVAAVEDYVARAPAGEGPVDWLRGDGTETAEAALRHAIRALLEGQRLDPSLRGMATTLTMLLVRGERGAIGHLGDSRAYLIRRRRVHQLTADSDLTRALGEGARPGEPAQLFSIELEPSDRLLLCTDGAESVVEDDTAIARVAADLSPAVLASRIASAAHRRNPGVDATVVAVRVAGDEGHHDLSLPGRDASFRHRVLERRSGSKR